MRYHNITKCDMLNGDGLRVVLWVSHCEHRCSGCQNPQTWCEYSGIPFDKKAKKELFEELSKDYISGITYSGGDPLSLLNRKEVLELAKEIRIKFPNKTQWIYTGYLYNEIKDLEGLSNIDILIDGKYIEELSVPSPNWCGSNNQVLYNLRNTND